MQSNFVAQVPEFKFSSRPTFLLACDTMGVSWLRDRFSWLSGAQPDAPFVIGDGACIASDDRCIISVAKARDRRQSEFARHDQTHFTWRLDAEEAAEIADKLRSLTESGVPGHQYIDLDHGRFGTIVVTKDEYPVETVRQMRDTESRNMPFIPRLLAEIRRLLEKFR
jgi:hypothetical protein